MIVVGRDSRVSGPWVNRVVEGIVQAMGFSVLQLGIVATPTVQFMVQEEKVSSHLFLPLLTLGCGWNCSHFFSQSHRLEWSEIRRIGWSFPASCRLEGAD